MAQDQRRFQVPGPCAEAKATRTEEDEQDAMKRLESRRLDNKAETDVLDGRCGGGIILVELRWPRVGRMKGVGIQLS
jgi:hypothetical protein